MKIEKIRSSYNVIKDLLSKNPKLIKILIGAIVIILLSLSFSGTINLGCGECNISYDPSNVKDIKKIIKE